jgi:hypothetical protein
MPWEKLPDPTSKDNSRMKAEFGRTARFLVDENLAVQRWAVIADPMPPGHAGAVP